MCGAFVQTSEAARTRRLAGGIELPPHRVGEAPAEAGAADLAAPGVLQLAPGGADAAADRDLGGRGLLGHDAREAALDGDVDPHSTRASAVQISRSVSRRGSERTSSSSPPISNVSPAERRSISRSADVEPQGVGDEAPRPEIRHDVRSTAHDPHRDRLAIAAGAPERACGHVRVGEERVDRGGEGAHQVRRATRSTCGRVQIGSGFDSISSRTHSSRSRSGMVRA